MLYYYCYCCCCRYCWYYCYTITTTINTTTNDNDGDNNYMMITILLGTWMWRIITVLDDQLVMRYTTQMSPIKMDSKKQFQVWITKSWFNTDIINIES